MWIKNDENFPFENQKNRVEEEKCKKGRYSYVRFWENHEKMVKSWEYKRKNRILSTTKRPVAYAASL